MKKVNVLLNSPEKVGKFIQILQNLTATLISNPDADVWMQSQ